jgi:hypothetical protein
VPALFAFIIVLALFWWASYKDRCLLLALAIMSMVGFPLHSPSTVFVFGIVAGCAARNWNVLRGFKFGSGRELHKRGQRSNYAEAGTGGQSLPV